MNARKTGGTIFDDEMPLFALFLPSVFHRDDADLIPWALCSVCLTIFICPLIVNRRKWLAWIIVEMCVCVCEDLSESKIVQIALVAPIIQPSLLLGSLLYLIIFERMSTSTHHYFIIIFLFHSTLETKSKIDPFFACWFNAVLCLHNFEHKHKLFWCIKKRKWEKCPTTRREEMNYYQVCILRYCSFRWFTVSSFIASQSRSVIEIENERTKTGMGISLRVTFDPIDFFPNFKLLFDEKSQARYEHFSFVATIFQPWKYSKVGKNICQTIFEYIIYAWIFLSRPLLYEHFLNFQQQFLYTELLMTVFDEEPQ